MMDIQPALRVAGLSKSFVVHAQGDLALTVLRDVALAVSPGECLALVGPSGAGKSTLGDLLLGLVTPTAGRILADGVPVQQAESWRGRAGYVAQDTFLFHDTIRANLLWANPAAGDDDLEWALRAAAADDIVSRLADGLDLASP